MSEAKFPPIQVDEVLIDWIRITTPRYPDMPGYGVVTVEMGIDGKTYQVEFPENGRDVNCDMAEEWCRLALAKLGIMGNDPEPDAIL